MQSGQTAPCSQTACQAASIVAFSPHRYIPRVVRAETLEVTGVCCLELIREGTGEHAPNPSQGVMESNYTDSVRTLAINNLLIHFASGPHLTTWSSWMHLSLCLAPVLVASTIAAHADVVNFSFATVPGSATSPFTLTNDGLTATVGSGTGDVLFTYYFGPEVYLLPNGGDEDGAITFTFSTDISALSVDFSTNDPFSRTAFDLLRDGVLVGTQYGYTPPASGGPGFGTASLTGDFDQVVVDTASVGSFTATTATPEPSTFALLGTGMLGAAGALRRKLA